MMPRTTRRATVFEKERLRPPQLRTVAERRWGDADYLRKSRLNARANGAMYLGGFVIECLLKAQLLKKYPWLQGNRGPARLSGDQAVLWSLCYRSHDLDEILLHLPEVSSRIENLDGKPDGPLLTSLRSICAEWTIYVRYSPRTATMRMADDFLRRVEELKKWLG